MHDESDFLRKLLENPADDTVRLVYADFLDERGDDPARARAAFLRLTARSLDPDRPAGDDAELRRLAAGLDTDWLAVVSRLKVEVCAGKRAANDAESDLLERALRAAGGGGFEFICDRRWDELTPTEDDAVRFCEGCRENVHYCDSITTAHEHARWGRCVAVDLGVIRCQGDLERPRMVLGFPDTSWFESAQMAVDPVSQERERRKQESTGQPAAQSSARRPGTGA